MARKCVIHNTYTPFFMLLAGLEPGTSPFSSFLAKRSTKDPGFSSVERFPHRSFELAVGTASWRGAILLSPQPFFPLGRVRVTLDRSLF